MWRAALTRPTRGQALVEFAFLAPVIVVLFFGLVDLGRGFFYQVEIADTARDTARVLAGEVQASAPPAAPIGPGTTAGCNEASRDLSGNGVVVDPPSPCSASIPLAAGHASVTFNCGASSDCQTPATTAQGCGMAAGVTQPNSFGTYPSCITVTVTFSFPLITTFIQNLAGSPTLTLTNSAQMLSLW